MNLTYLASLCEHKDNDKTRLDISDRDEIVCEYGIKMAYDSDLKQLVSRLMSGHKRLELSKKKIAFCLFLIRFGKFGVR